MGWVNYVVVPEHKVMFEVSRYLDDDYTDEYFEAYIRLKELVEEIDLYESLRVPLSEIKASDFGKIVYAIENIFHFIVGLEPEHFLLLYLKAMGVEYYVISEFELEANREAYKGFKILDLRGV